MNGNAWDLGSVYYSNQQLGDNQANSEAHKLHRIRCQFREFIRNFRQASSQVFPYRVQLLERFRKGDHKLVVSLEDLHNYDDGKLLDQLLSKPKEHLDLLEQAVKDALVHTLPSHDINNDMDLPNIQVLLSSRQAPSDLRTITAKEINGLILVSGIITSAKRSSSKATVIKAMCSKCKHKVTIPCPQVYSPVQLPRSCVSGGEDACDVSPTLFCIENMIEPHTGKRHIPNFT